MDFKRYGFVLQEIGEYTYVYHYRETTVNHRIKEYSDEDTGTSVVVVEKETRKKGDFIRLPQSLWITRDGYPPLSTDGSLLQVGDHCATTYFAGIPTVQSEEHSEIFDSCLSRELKELDMDYSQLSQRVKSGMLFKNCTISGFVYNKSGMHDTKLLQVLQEKAVKSYAAVLTSKPRRCPVNMWTEMIMGYQADFEYHLFRRWGFDVPLSAQRAFFTIMMGPRTSDLKNNEEAARLQAIVSLTRE